MEPVRDLKVIIFEKMAMDVNAGNKNRLKYFEDDDEFLQEIMGWWQANFDVREMDKVELAHLITDSWPAIFLLTMCEYITKIYNTSNLVAERNRIGNDFLNNRNIFGCQLTRLNIFTEAEIRGYVKNVHTSFFLNDFGELIEDYQKLNFDPLYFIASRKFLALDYPFKSLPERVEFFEDCRDSALAKMNVVHFLNSAPYGDSKFKQTDAFIWLEKLKELSELYKKLGFYTLPFLLCRVVRVQEN